ALLLDDDGDVGANFTGGGFGGEMQVGGCWDGKLHAARNRFQLPVTIGAGIALHGNASGSGMSLHVICRALNINFAAGGFCFDTAAWFGDSNDAGNSVDDHVTPSVRDGDAA